MMAIKIREMDVQTFVKFKMALTVGNCMASQFAQDNVEMRRNIDQRASNVMMETTLMEMAALKTVNYSLNSTIVASTKRVTKQHVNF